MHGDPMRPGIPLPAAQRPGSHDDTAGAAPTSQAPPEPRSPREPARGRPAAPSLGMPLAPDADAERTVVLVVHRDQAAVEALAHALRLEGFTVEWAGSPAVACALLDDLDPQLVLADPVTCGAAGYGELRTRCRVPVGMLGTESLPGTMRLLGQVPRPRRRGTLD